MKKIFWAVMIFVLLLIFRVEAFALDCPRMPAQVKEDSIIGVNAAVSKIGPLKGPELKSHLQLTANDLLGKLPNADKVYLEQMIFSAYCSAIRDDKNIAEGEKAKLIKKYRETLYDKIVTKRNKPLGYQEQEATEKNAVTVSQKKYQPNTQPNNQPNTQSNTSVSSQGQSGGITAQNVTVTNVFTGATQTLTVTPSNRYISPKTSEKFLLIITNHTDQPLYSVSLLIRIDEGDLLPDNIKFESQDKTKMQTYLGDAHGGPIVSWDLMGITGKTPEGKSVMNEFIYLINSKHDKEFLVIINGDDLKKQSKVSFEIAGYSTEPQKVIYGRDLNSNCTENDNFDNAYEKGKRLRDSKELSEAMICFKRMIKLNPNSAKAHTNLGATYYDIGEKDSASDEFKIAIKLDPNAPQPQFNLGVLLMDSNDCNAAIQRFEYASKLDHPRIKLDSLVAWGECLKRLGATEKAFQKYQLSIDTDPKYGLAYFHWGADLLDQGQNSQAIDKFRKASELDDSIRLDALGMWGVALEKMDKKSEAKAKYQEVIDLAPNTEQAEKSRNSIRKLTGEVKSN